MAEAVVAFRLADRHGGRLPEPHGGLLSEPHGRLLHERHGGRLPERHRGRLPTQPAMTAIHAIGASLALSEARMG
jgi:hypothetical protein